MATPATSGSLEQAVQARVEQAAASRGYQAYSEVRRQVFAMRDREDRAAGTTAEPSAYWREELDGFDYMLDAPPMVVAKLRHHCYHLTGLRPYDYRTLKDKAQRKVERRKRQLEGAGRRDLIIPEPDLLGGFGFRIDGALYNVDTLKYNEALIALERAGVLDDLRQADRPVAWEIGSGWGGFAYQLKSTVPNATLVLSDFPEVFLFSATYLLTAFPDANVLFEGSDEDPGAASWTDYDFVFVSNTRTDAVRPPHLNLTSNMVSFQEMRSDQVEAYVGHAARAGSQALYSLNRERSLYNPELSSTTAIIAEQFELREVPVLEDSYAEAGKTKQRPLAQRARDAAGRLAARLPRSRTQAPGPPAPATGPGTYRHLVGRPRSSS